MSDMHGTVCWSELMTRDVAGALDYYGAVCGWSIDEMEMPQGGTYRIGLANGKPVAGIMDMAPMDHMADVPPHWFTYFAVDDVDAAVRETESRGGEVLRAPFEVPGVGRIAILKDPAGAAMGMMTPADRPAS